ncbi:hypothetical protein GCM10010178_92340 [Lentzea flava]|uniref:Transposase n=1 Tax=Lentzea flava TaxID=103732 RepID=A0ABQ2VIP6_9PSEU|nr:hypothetical protein GCM10010178_92340 [Lentzea flava]
MCIPEVPCVVDEWRRTHPGEPVPDGQVFVQPWPAGPTDERKDQVRCYQYKHDRARRTLKGIDEQVRKAEQAVAGKTAVKRNRFVKLTDATKTVNRELEAKARGLAGIKGYVTNIADPRPSRSSALTTGCSRSRRASGWPNPTWPPARSTTAPRTRSRRI